VGRPETAYARPGRTVNSVFEENNWEACIVIRQLINRQTGGLTGASARAHESFKGDQAGWRKGSMTYIGH